MDGFMTHIITDEQRKFLNFYTDFLTQEVKKDDLQNIFCIIKDIESNNLQAITQDYHEVQALMKQMAPMTCDFIMSDFNAIARALEEGVIEMNNDSSTEFTAFFTQSFTVILHYTASNLLLNLLGQRKAQLEASQKVDTLTHLLTQELLMYTREMIDTAYDIRVLAAKLDVGTRQVQQAMQKLIVHDAIYVDVRNNHLIYSLNDEAKEIVAQYIGG